MEPRAEGGVGSSKTPPARDEQGAQRIELGDANVLAARSLGTLALFERHGLTFTQVVEPGVGAGRVVEEVLVAVARQDETETLVADEPLDRAVHRCHCESLLETYALVIDLRGTGCFRGVRPALKAGSALKSWLA